MSPDFGVTDFIYESICLQNQCVDEITNSVICKPINAWTSKVNWLWM